MTRLDRLLLLLLGCCASCLAQDVTAVQIKVVKDAPFSAQSVTDTSQVLADGTHVVHQNTALLARDSEGRTRREQTMTGGASVVFIHDPVAGFAYAVDPTNKSVRRFSISTAASMGAAGNGESLGSQTIEGLQVDGTRVTRTIAVGEAGNDKPIQVIVEAWYSKDLQMVISRKTTDPRVGEVTYTLTGLQRVEPSHSLFEIPADYSVHDEVTPIAKIVVSK